MIAASVTVVASGGLPIIEAPNGVPVTNAAGSVPVTFSTVGYGLPVQFISDAPPAPPGPAPAVGVLDFSDPLNSGQHPAL